METNEPNLTPLAQALVTAFEQKPLLNREPKITVNRFVSALASGYEKIRNAMDIRDEEVVLRSAIERILKRRIILGGGGGKQIAGILIRELLWAKYFPDNTIPEALVLRVEEMIDLHLELKRRLVSQKKLPESLITQWMYQLLSSDISKLLNPKTDKEIMSNFMFQILHQKLNIKDDSEDNKNIQIFLAVRRAFARDDLAFLRYHLFKQIYGELSRENIDHVAETFTKAHEEMEKQLKYPLKEKIYLFVRKQTPIFFILEDVLTSYQNSNIIAHITNKEEFSKAVYAACEIRYKSISSKVRTAIIRSVFFLLLTKVIFAYAIEGTYDRITYGKIMWNSLALNIIIPPILMIVVSLFIRTPNQENSKRILNRINTILHDENPELGSAKVLELHPKTNRSLMTTSFALLWLLAFVISFGVVIYVLNKLQFNFVSQGIFVFFLTIVSFLSWRINVTANMYKIEDRQGLFTPFIDFLFLPVIKVGMKLTDGISQINILIFVFDFIIESPFKSIFNFFEQWFLYLHTKREDLG